MVRRAALPALALALFAAAPAAAATEVVFPSDELTVPDARQATGRRVDLPRTDCRRQRTRCDAIRLVNGLDGFDLDPRIAIRFDRSVSLRRAAKGITCGSPAAARPSASIAWCGTHALTPSTRIRPSSCRRAASTGSTSARASRAGRPGRASPR